MEYEKFLKQNKEEMISALQEVVRINSEEGEVLFARTRLYIRLGRVYRMLSKPPLI